jgi:hypothetical protein
MSCPVCGNKGYREDPTRETAQQKLRICSQCGREYQVHRLDFVNGAAALLAGAILMFLVLTEWFAPPRDLPIYLTWSGRVALLGLSSFLFTIGGMLVSGKRWP